MKNNSRRNAKEPFEWNVSATTALAKAEILELQRQHESMAPAKEDFKFTEPRVSMTHPQLLSRSLDDVKILHVQKSDTVR